MAIIAIIILTACSTTEGEKETANEEDQVLDKPGEKVNDPEINFDVELISINEPSDKIEQGQVDMIIENAGEQIDTLGNEIVEDGNFARMLHGEVIDQSMTGIIIKDSNPRDIENIK